MINLKQFSSIVVLAVLLSLSSLKPFSVSVKAEMPLHGVISLTFDDGLPCHYDVAFQLMSERSLHGTFYVPTGVCPTQDYKTNMISTSQMLTMQSAGNEIGSHSVTHPDFTMLTDAQIEMEAKNSKESLVSQGLNINNFAYPYGTGDLSHADSIVLKYYRSARGVDYAPMTLNNNVFHLPCYTSEVRPYALKMPALKNIIDYTAIYNQWTILLFHYITDWNSANTYGGIATSDFAALLDYLKMSPVQVLTVNEALNLGVTPPMPPPIQPPTTIIVNVTLQPFGVKPQFSLVTGTAWTAPDTVTVWGKTWVFQGWSDGGLNKTRTFNSPGDFTVNYG